MLVESRGRNENFLILQGKKTERRVCNERGNRPLQEVHDRTHLGLLIHT